MRPISIDRSVVSESFVIPFPPIRGGGNQIIVSIPSELSNGSQLTIIARKLFYITISFINIPLFIQLMNTMIGFEKQSKLDTNDKIMI